MRQSLGMAAFALPVLVFVSSVSVYCAEQDPVKFLSEFYAWYIPAQSQMYPEYHRNIYGYVARETVEEIKKRSELPGRDRTDYFLKMNDTPSDISRTSIHVSQVEQIGTDTFVALVTFVVTFVDGEKRAPDNVVVVMKEINGKIKIMKCVDVYPEA